MTVYQDNLHNLALAKTSLTEIYFIAKRFRDSSTRMILRERVRVPIASDGSFTTPNLDPGPAEVWLGIEKYDIEIDDSPSPIRLGPAIIAGLPVAVESSNHIASDGSVRLAKVMTTTEYATLTASTTPEPGSVFHLYN